MKKDLSFGSINDLCHVEYGTRVVKKLHAGTVYPVYGGGGATFFMDEFNREDQFIISRFGMSENCTRFVEGKFFLNDSGLSLKPKDENILNQRYLDYQCLSLNDVIFSLGKGSAQKNLHVDSFKQLMLACHPLRVQKQIVENLDAAFADIDKAISATEKNIENAEALFKRYLDSIFEGDTEVDNYKKIKDVALIKGGKRVPKGYKLLKENTEYPYLRVTDFNDNGGIDDENLQYINEEIFSQIKNYTISSEDLYISIAGTIGKSGIVPKHLSGANLTENACKLVFKEGTSNKFFYYFTKSSSFSYQAIEQTRVAGQPKLALNRLGEIMLILPPLSEQEILLEQFSELESISLKLREIYASKISNLTALKTSILNQAFLDALTKDVA